MPSIRSCLTSLVVALSMTPLLASHTPTAVGGLATKRDITRGHLVAERLAARDGHIAKRTARKGAAGKGPVGKGPVGKGPVGKGGRGGKSAPAVVPSPAEQAAASALDPYAPNGIFLSSTLATSAATRRCGIDRTCQVSVTVPAHATAYCVNRQCTFRCDGPAFAPSGTVCAAAPSQCPNQANCPGVTNGFTGCGSDGRCTANCQTDQGFTLFSNTDGSALICLNLNTDVSNCGAAGNACPASYNGVGSPVCRSGQCTLACTVGLRPRSTSSGATFCA